jgi:hypothetical protein
VIVSNGCCGPTAHGSVVVATAANPEAAPVVVTAVEVVVVAIDELDPGEFSDWVVAVAVDELAPGELSDTPLEHPIINAIATTTANK